MFFVGGTGQLLTLLLTVCLPFVFFITGHQNIKIADASNVIAVHQIQLDVSQEQINIGSYSEAFCDENRYFDLNIEDVSFRKIPLREFNVKKEWFNVGSNGNKAPPVFHCFC